jgi:hypothetical protein
MDLGLAVLGWVDVGTAAQEQAIEPIEQCARVIVLWWEDHGDATGGKNGVRVVRREEIAFEDSVGLRVANQRRGDADDRLHVVTNSWRGTRIGLTERDQHDYRGQDGGLGEHAVAIALSGGAREKSSKIARG